MKAIAPSLLLPYFSCAAAASAPLSPPTTTFEPQAAPIEVPREAPLEAASRPLETSPKAAPFATACRADIDCGYDPSTDRCGSDPRWNRQPPIVDQGILCYCDARREVCSLFRVLPAPCEGDFSCAVGLDPRPHPTRATRDAPHERGRPCRDYVLATSCERTNICTLRRLDCGRR